MKIFGRLVIGMVVGAAAIGTTVALAAFPERPVQFVTPSDPGGGNDVVARVIAARLQDKWGKPVVVLNKPGGNQMIGEAFVANAPPDGHTVLFIGSIRTFLAAAPVANSGYDMANGLVGITQLGKQPWVIVANTDLPAKTLPDLVKLAKASPNKLNRGDNGVGGPADLIMRRFMKATGTELFQISYRAGGEMVAALLKNEVNVGITTISLAGPQIKAGKLIGLAVTDDVRSPAYPEIPTVAEAIGVGSFVATQWYGVFVPAGTPKDIVAKLNEDILAVMELPEVRRPFINEGLEIVASKQADFEQVLKDEIAAWRSVLNP